jgi:hypothetical protein
MMLGKGHSISLTLAHLACNLYKEKYLQILPAYLNKNRPDKHKIGFSTKAMNKWRLMEK